MGVGRGIRDDARDLDAVPTELGCEAAPEVLRGDDVDLTGCEERDECVHVPSLAIIILSS